MNTKAWPATQQNLQYDAFFCPHPECSAVGTCQKGIPGSNFSSSNRHQGAVQTELESFTPGFLPSVQSRQSRHQLLIPQFRHSLSIHSATECHLNNCIKPSFASPIFSSPTCLNRATCRNILGLWPVRCENKTLQLVTPEPEVWHRHWSEFLI